MNSTYLKAWIQASRLPFYVATFIPLFIGWLLAINDGNPVQPLRFFLVFLGSFMVHLVTNLANDYFDHILGTDSGESIGGSRVIQEGKIAAGTLLKVIIILYVLSFAVGFIIVFKFKLYLLAIPILFAAFSSFFYVAPPVRYGYHGLGELFVGINMGPIMVVGTYWVISGHPGLTPLFISLPVGLMVALILYYQSLPDMRTDTTAGKRTLAVRLGRKGAFRGLILFFFLIYLSLVCLIFSELLSWLSFTFLFSVPLAYKLLSIVRNTKDWVLLDQYGSYVRFFYFICGLSIIVGLF